MGMGEKDTELIFKSQESIIDTTEKIDSNLNINENNLHEPVYRPGMREKEGAKTNESLDLNKFGLNKVNEQVRENALRIEEIRSSRLGAQLESAKKRTLFSSEDSEEMKRIKNKVKDIQKFYTEDRTEANLLKYTESLEAAYLDAIAACQYYLKKKTTIFGNDRYKAVNSTMNKMLEELSTVTSFKLAQADMVEGDKSEFANASNIMYFMHLNNYIDDALRKKKDDKKYYNGRVVEEEKDHTRDAAKVNKFVEDLNKTPKLIAGLFAGMVKPSELVKELGEDGKNIAFAAAELVKKFDKNKAHTEYINTTNFGYKDGIARSFEGSKNKIQHTTMAIMQEKDGTVSLRIIGNKEDSKILELKDLNIEMLRSNIVGDIMDNEKVFGEAFTNKELSFIKDEKFDDNIAKRDAAIDLIVRRFKLDRLAYGQVFRNLKTDKLISFATRMIDGEKCTLSDFQKENHIMEYEGKVSIFEYKTVSYADKMKEIKAKEKKKVDLKELPDIAKDIFMNDDEDEDAKKLESDDDNINLEGMKENDQNEDNILDNEKDFAEDFEIIDTVKEEEGHINTSEIMEKVERSKKDAGEILTKVVHKEQNKKEKKKREEFVVEEEKEELTEEEIKNEEAMKLQLEEEEKAKKEEAKKEEEEYKNLTEWNEKEKALQNLVGELFFSEDSVLADNLTKKAENHKYTEAQKKNLDDETLMRAERVKNVLVNNSRAIAEILKDETLLQKFVNRLALPEEFSKDTIQEAIKGLVDELGEMKEVVEKQNVVLLSIGISQRIIQNSEKKAEKFAALDRAIDEMVEKGTKSIQEKMTGMIDEVLNSKNNEKEKEEENAKKYAKEYAQLRKEAEAEIDKEIKDKEKAEENIIDTSVNKINDLDEINEERQKRVDELFEKKKKEFIFEKEDKEKFDEFKKTHAGNIREVEDKAEVEATKEWKKNVVNAINDGTFKNDPSIIMHMKKGKLGALINRDVSKNPVKPEEIDNEVQVQLKSAVPMVMAQMGLIAMQEKKNPGEADAFAEKYYIDSMKSDYKKKAVDKYYQEEKKRLSAQSKDEKLFDSVIPPNETVDQKNERERGVLNRIANDSMSGDSGQGLFIKNVLKEYFTSVDTMDKRSMFGFAIKSIKPIPKTKKYAKLEKESERKYEEALENSKRMKEDYEEKLEQYNKELKEYHDKLNEYQDELKNGPKKEEGLFAGLFGKNFNSFFGMANKVEKKEETAEERAVRISGEIEKLKKPSKPVAPKEMEKPKREVIFPEKFEKKYMDEQMGEFVGGIFKGAGPLFQKLLQGLPVNKDTNPILRRALDDVKSNLLPIPKAIVDAQLLDMVNKSKGAIERIEIVNSLGAASVGQAFLCKLYGPNLEKEGKEVVVKILRPDAQNRMNREKKIMLRCAGKTNEGMVATYLGQLARIEEELNLSIEARNVKLGSVYDKSRNKDGSYDHVESMKLCNLVEPTEDYMVIEKSEGVTVDKYIKDMDQKLKDCLTPFIVEINGVKSFEKDYKGYNIKVDAENTAKHTNTVHEINKMIEDAKKRQRYLITLSEKWVEEGLFTSGFYHGDLHAGNIMVSENNATVIDFGNATQLSDKDKLQITRMMISAGMNDVDEFMNAYKNLMTNTESMNAKYQEVKPKFKALLTKILNLSNMESTGERIAVSLLKAQELGLELPSAIQNFSSCQIRLANTINSMNEMISELERARTQLAKEKSDSGVNSTNYYKATREGILTNYYEAYNDNLDALYPDEYVDTQKNYLLRNTYFAGVDVRDVGGVKQYKEAEEENKKTKELFFKDIDCLAEDRKNFEAKMKTSQYSEHGGEVIGKFLEETRKVKKPGDAYTVDYLNAMRHARSVRREFEAYLKDVVATKTAQNAPIPAGYNEALELIKKISAKETSKKETPSVDEIQSLMSKYNEIMGTTSVEEDMKAYWNKLEDDKNKLSENEKTELKEKIWSKYKRKLNLTPPDNIVSERYSLSNTKQRLYGMNKTTFKKEMKAYLKDDEYGAELEELSSKYFELTKEQKKAREKDVDKANEISALIDKEQYVPKMRQLIALISLKLMNGIYDEKNKIMDSKSSAAGEPENFLNVMGNVMRNNVKKTVGRMGLTWAWKHSKQISEL